MQVHSMLQPWKQPNKVNQYHLLLDLKKKENAVMILNLDLAKIDTATLY